MELDFLPLFKSAKLFFRPASPAPHPPPPTASWSVTALKLLPQLAPSALSPLTAWAGREQQAGSLPCWCLPGEEGGGSTLLPRAPPSWLGEGTCPTLHYQALVLGP